MASLTGTIDDDILNGTTGADDISGLAGNDRITGGGGDDVIRAGDGFDNVVFSDVFANYTISAVSGGKVQSEQYFTVTHNNGGADGTDTIYMDAEFFDFADRSSVPRAQLVSSAEADDGDEILGTDGPDNNLSGTTGNDVINALGGNDTIVGTIGDDTISGGSGLDFVAYTSYSSSNVSLTTANGITTFSAAGFTDELQEVERLQLSDTWLALDFNGQAGAAAKIIVAAFGQELLPQYLSVGIGLADSGQSAKDLADLVVGSNLMDYDGSGAEFIDLVFNNLLSRDANVLEQTLYGDYLDRGLYTQAELLAIAADTQMANALMVDYAIDNVGLPYDAGLV